MIAQSGKRISVVKFADQAWPNWFLLSDDFYFSRRLAESLTRCEFPSRERRGETGTGRMARRNCCRIENSAVREFLAEFLG